MCSWGSGKIYSFSRWHLHTCHLWGITFRKSEPKCNPSIGIPKRLTAYFRIFHYTFHLGNSVCVERENPCTYLLYIWPLTEKCLIVNIRRERIHNWKIPYPSVELSLPNILWIESQNEWSDSMYMTSMDCSNIFKLMKESRKIVILWIAPKFP